MGPLREHALLVIWRGACIGPVSFLINSMIRDRSRKIRPRLSNKLVPQVLAVALAAATFGFVSSVGASSVSRVAKVSSPSPCAARVVYGVIPAWARAGFSQSKPRMHYELGSKGDIAALLFAYPLLSPPPRTHNNKILWVSHASDNGSTMLIRAQRMKGSVPIGRVVTRQVIGGPGPSIVNLPYAGCWQLNLSWSGHHDVVDVIYVDNRSG